jgi:hypothetical protein
MRDYGKHAIVPYEPLIAFANETITEKNWADVLSNLGSWAVPEGMPEGQAWKWRNEIYRRLGWMAPRTLGGEMVNGPTLQEVQKELKKDLARITDPTRDIEASAEDFDAQVKRVRTAFNEAREQGLSLHESHQKANRLPGVPAEKNLTWLINKYQNFPPVGEPRQDTQADGKTAVERQRVAEITIPMTLFPVRRRAEDLRVFVTDRVYFVPTIDDLRTWVYFRLAKLWEDGLLPQLGRCERCEKFFLAKTRRKKGTVYCSQSCAQAKTAVVRTKATRARRAEWESVRDDLERAMEQMRPTHQPVERKALDKGETILQKAARAFQDAYRRGEGPGYEEGKALLARARKQINRVSSGRRAAA